MDNNKRKTTLVRSWNVDCDRFWSTKTLLLTSIPLWVLLNTADAAFGQTVIDQDPLVQTNIDQNPDPNNPAPEPNVQQNNQTRSGLLRPTIEEQLGRADRTNIRATTVEPQTTVQAEDDPFAPLGFRIGTLRLTTSIEQRLGYTTNRQSSSDGDAGIESNSIGEFELRSDWSRHELQVIGRATYQTNFDNQIEPDPTAEIEGQLRLDLIDGYQVTLGSGYAYETESASSVNLNQFVVNEPGVHTYGAFAQVERSQRRLGFTLRGGIERQTYESAKLSGGGIQSQRDRDRTGYIIQSRLTYNNGLAFSPFIQGNYSAEVYDLRTDRNGEQRDNATYELRGGIVVDLSEKLNGEISAGYINQEFVDPGLKALSGLTIDANLNWSPKRDTLLTLALSSDMEGSTNPGDSGAITYEGSLSARHRARANLELNAQIGFSHTNYEGLGREDTSYNAQAGFAYWLSRSLSLTGELSHETVTSTDADNAYNETSILFGIKLQK